MRGRRVLTAFGVIIPTAAQYLIFFKPEVDTSEMRITLVKKRMASDMLNPNVLRMASVSFFDIRIDRGANCHGFCAHTYFFLTNHLTSLNRLAMLRDGVDVAFGAEARSPRHDVSALTRGHLMRRTKTFAIR